MGRLFKNLLYRPLLNNAPCIDHYHIICNLRHNPQCVETTAAALERCGMAANAGMVADCGLETEQVYTDLRHLPEDISYFATIVAD